MSIPEFHFSESFLGNSNVPCFAAAIKNSELPRMGFRHIAEFEEDPECEIYLRGRNPKKISPWQQEILEKLFVKEGLTAVVAEAMKEYETSSKWRGRGYAELAEADRQKIREYGIAAYVTVAVIVIDEIDRKVILRADTIIDGNLDEHGISIYLSKGRWRFDTAEYFDRYQSKFGVDDEEKRREFTKREWELLYPVSGHEPDDTDAGLLIGRWALDEPESIKLLKQLRVDSLQAHLLLRERNNIGLLISQEMIREFDLSPPIVDWTRGRFRLLKIERRGNRFALHLRRLRRKGTEYVDDEDGSIRDINFWCDGRCLVESTGVVYRPTDQSPVKNPPEQSPEYMRQLYGLPSPQDDEGGKAI